MSIIYILYLSSYNHVIVVRYNNVIWLSNQSLVPLDLNKFQFVFLLLSLVLSDDDQISVGALVNVLAAK